MSFTSSTAFSCVSVGLILVLLFALFRYFSREKYAQSFSRMPDPVKERLVKTDRVLIQVFRIFLWVSPLYLLVVPLALFFVDKENFLATAICMALLVVTIWQEYLFRKWLINYLETRQLLKSSPENGL
ncbi:MAG: hypothetical protein HYZ25_21125 [Chloroflexi bacterium]|nr:hypothetical protein [Chloroflexota bacterium]